MAASALTQAAERAMDAVLAETAAYARRYRSGAHGPHPTADAEALRQRFGLPLPEAGRAS